MKALIGITPNGVVSFTSELYCGSIGDPDIVKRSGYLQHIQRGDKYSTQMAHTESVKQY